MSTTERERWLWAEVAAGLLDPGDSEAEFTHKLVDLATRVLQVCLEAGMSFDRAFDEVRGLIRVAVRQHFQQQPAAPFEQHDLGAA